MNKVLVVLYIPIIEMRYDVYIPINKKIEQIIILLGNALNELTDGGFILQNNTILINKETGNIYDNNQYVKNAEIKNGTELVLI